MINVSVGKSLAKQAGALKLTVDELKEMPDEVKEKWRMGLLLIPYVQLDSVRNMYRLNITKEEALKLGVIEKEYEARIKEIEATNKLIKSLMQKGDTF